MKFHENPSSGSLVVPCGRTDMTKLVVAFCNFAKSQCANENKTNFRSPQRTYNKSTNSIKVFKSMYISPCTCMYTRARWNIYIGLSLHVYAYTCTVKYTYWFVTARVCLHVQWQTNTARTTLYFQYTTKLLFLPHVSATYGHHQGDYTKFKYTSLKYCIKLTCNNIWQETNCLV